VPVATTVEQADDVRCSRRAERYSARYVVNRESKIERLQLCGRKSVNGGGVMVRVAGAGDSRRAGFSGLSTCGSVWSCPVCSAKVLAHRATELQQALETWQGQGGRVVMVTLTMRHQKWQRLKSLWDGLSYAWGAVTSGRAWEDLQNEHGVLTERVISQGARRGQLVAEQRLGWVRAVEVTVGDNGWHVHVHAVLFVAGDVSEQAADYMGAAMFQRWRDALVRKGFQAPLSGSGGLHVNVWSGETDVLGDYFTKNTYRAGSRALALEAAAGTLKKGRKDNRTPFEVLADIVALGDVDDLALWHEWEQGSRNRRQMTWSLGLRDRLEVGQELTDEEIAEQQLGGEDLVLIEPKGWRRAVALRLHAQLLDAAEADDGGVQLVQLLDRYGIGWNPPPIR
jgi:hypothetical protein